MLNFSFSYKDFTISIQDSVDDIPYVVKCVSSNSDTCFIKDFFTRGDAFTFIGKLLCFIDILV